MTALYPHDFHESCIMYDLWLFGALIAAWFILNRWVLPLCGIPTCMSGGCARPHHAPPPAARVDEDT